VYLENGRSTERATVVLILDPLIQTLHMKNMATFSKPAHSIPRHKVAETNSTDNSLVAVSSDTPVIEDGGQIVANALLLRVCRDRGNRGRRRIRSGKDEVGMTLTGGISKWSDGPNGEGLIWESAKLMV